MVFDQRNLREEQQQFLCGNSVPIMENRAGRRGRRRKQLLDDLKETRVYWKFKGEALDHPQRRARFGGTTDLSSDTLRGGDDDDDDDYERSIILSKPPAENF